MEVSICSSSSSPSKYFSSFLSCAKFRYIIHGIPKNKKYTIEEARWCDQHKQFIGEQIHTVTFVTLKQWLGYIPSVLGDIKTIMWMGFPSSVYKETNDESPLHLWENNHDTFLPHSLEKMRFFPEGTCHEQASQIQSP